MPGRPARDQWRLNGSVIVTPNGAVVISPQLNQVGRRDVCLNVAIGNTLKKQCGFYLYRNVDTNIVPGCPHQP
jgi:hypothetical protein